eukprot:TRINITY_DN2184_c1_g1_i8.p1 TRINITY_DN2184_c1_g1~~TRINITY_DN2184_c1_g1_i8.p1  ORF type:complete len:346 (-),score=47.07 TRINITY_DN2184_c1_g1_i8:634-1584(-)
MQSTFKSTSSRCARMLRSHRIIRSDVGSMVNIRHLVKRHPERVLCVSFQHKFAQGSHGRWQQRYFCGTSPKGKDPQEKRESKGNKDQDAKKGPADSGKDAESDTSEGKDDGKGDSARQERTSNRGEAISWLGLSGFGLSLILRNPVAARALRIAGPAGMLAGMVLSIYEVGGWRLLISIPVFLVGLSGAGNLLNAWHESRLKQDIVNDLKVGCPELTSDVLDALQLEHGHEYETNRLRLAVECRQEASEGIATAWRVECKASRTSGLHPWSVVDLQASRGTAIRDEASDGQPPPQTRFWDSSGQGVRFTWQVVWQK